uniref:uncharacterized protein LOC120341348 n=1 Tax=Styela clava TaxID=7725 RepID=UPI00193AA1E7|nr:uncharacterized protein LOC120341348 [Styela clava]
MNVAVVEYKGIFPGHTPHGNAKINQQAYIRTSADFMENIISKCECVTAKKLYVNLQQHAEENLRNLRQIENARFNQKKKKQGAGIKIYHKNYADEILEVINMAQTNEFVQKVTHSKMESVNVTLFFEEQCLDLKRFCCSGKTILGFDKTFNLGRVYVTVTVFKNLSLLSCKSGEHPLFFGPIFLHHKSDKSTFTEFFTNIKSKLGRKLDNLTVGTDDESALHGAFTSSFPDSTHVLCSRHMRENLINYLKDKVGTSVNLRRSIVSEAFGLFHCQNEKEFDSKTEEVVSYCKTRCKVTYKWIPVDK